MNYYKRREIGIIAIGSEQWKSVTKESKRSVEEVCFPSREAALAQRNIAKNTYMVKYRISQKFKKSRFKKIVRSSL